MRRATAASLRSGSSCSWPSARAHERHPRLRVQQRVVALEIPPICGHRDHSPEHRVERRRRGEVAGHPCRQGIAGHAVDVRLDDQREGEPGDADRESRVIEPVPEPALAREDQRGEHTEDESAR